MPHFRTMDLNGRTMDLNGPLYNQLSGDTFEFAEPSKDPNAKNQPKQPDNSVMDELRDLLFPAGSGANEDQDAIFDNIVGFYEVTETEGGINTGPEDDIIA